MTRFAFVMIGVIFLITAGLATPTLVGPSGLIVLPDAIPTPTVQLAATVIDNFDQRGLALRAVAPLGDAELGVSYLNDDLNLWGGHGKVQLSEGRVASALGGLILSSDEVDTTGAYLAATIQPARWLSATGGALWTRMSTSAGADADVRPYLGVRAQVGTRLILSAEHMLRGDTLGEIRGITSVMLTRDAGKTVQSTIGFTNAVGLLGQDDTYYFAGFTYRLAP